MNIFVTTSMRTGSTWICDMISSLFGTPWTFWAKGRDIPQKRFQDQIDKEPQKGVNIFKMHFTPPQRICECIKHGDKNNFVLSITRDLRDLAVSKIFYIRYNAPMRTIKRLDDLNDIRRKFGKNKMPDRRYINKFIDSKHFDHIVNNWKMYNDGFEHPNYMLLDYEKLNSKRTLFWIKNVCDFLGIYRNNKALRAVIVNNNFQSKTGRSPGEGSNSSFRRKGIVGDYEKWINAKNLEKIERIINESKGIKTEEKKEQIPKGSIDYLKPKLIELGIILYDKVANEFKLNKKILNKL